MNQSLLSNNCLVIVFEWLNQKEKIESQRICLKFYSKIIPQVMWRLRSFAFIGNTVAHYFKIGTNDVYQYDVMKKGYTQSQIN